MQVSHRVMVLVVMVLMMTLGSQWVPLARSTAGAYGNHHESLAAGAACGTAMDSNDQPGLLFVENRGQFDPAVRFQAHDHGTTLWLTDDALWLTILDGTPPDRSVAAPGQTIHQTHIKIGFPASNPQVLIEPLQQAATRMSYFIGDQSAWRRDVAAWSGLRYRNLYPGVDLIMTASRAGWLWCWQAADAQSLGRVRLSLEGARDPWITGGSLQIPHRDGTLAVPLPYVLASTAATVAPTAPSLRRSSSASATYIIDHPFGDEGTRAPISQPGATGDLVYSSFLGGSAADLGNDITYDSSGAMYVTGTTDSNDFPTTPGAFDTLRNIDVFIVKLNPAGTSLVYATYLGGTSGILSFNSRLAVDSAGAAYVLGTTDSANFATTPGAFDQTLGGGSSTDLFVSKLDASGSTLLYSTYIGGMNIDSSGDIMIDTNGNAYVTGSTYSADFPTTPNAFDRTYANNQNGMTDDAFVVKLNPTGSALVYGTYLGGNDWDSGASIALDSSKNAYITGRTHSIDFPTTVGAYGRQLAAGDDVFITKVDTSGSSLVYSSFLGGEQEDHAEDITVDGTGNAYITGTTSSSAFPVTTGAFDRSYNGGAYGDGFVVKMNASGTGLGYSSFLGGSLDDRAHAIGLDSSRNIYIAGDTASADFPVTGWGFDGSFNGMHDMFLVVFAPTGGLIYGSYVGGTDNDSARAYNADMNMAVGVTGMVYLTGYTYSSDFPITADAYDGTFAGNDALVVKLVPTLAPGATPTPTLPAPSTQTPPSTPTTTPTATRTSTATATRTSTPTATRTAISTPVLPSNGLLTTASPWYLSGQDMLVLAAIRSGTQPVAGLTGVTVHFNSQQVPLYDDGTHGDAYARDGLYTTFLAVPNQATLDLELRWLAQVLDYSSLRQQADPKLLLLTDWTALHAEFRDTGMTVNEDHDANGVHDFFDLVDRIRRYAAVHQGVVIDLPHALTIQRGFNQNYRDLDYNAGTHGRWQQGVLIDALVSAIDAQVAADALAMVAIIGDDQVVPFYRVFDPTDYYSYYNVEAPFFQSLERGYPNDVGGTQGNAVLIDAGQGYILSDVPYSVRTPQVITVTSWIPALPHDLARPQPTFGLGRIFTARPLELLQAIDRYEQPLFMTQDVAAAGLFLGADYPNELLVAPMAYRSVVPGMEQWFGDKLLMNNAVPVPWSQQALVDALNTRNLISWWGHTTHENLWVGTGSDVLATHLKQIDPQTPVVFAGMGCHLALSVSDSPDGIGTAFPYSEALVNPLLAHGVTMFGPTSWAYTQGPAFPDPSLHELMVALFVNSLFDSTAPTTGDIWRDIFPRYHTADPGFIENNNPATHLFHITGAYGISLYGLPTQPIERFQATAPAITVAYAADQQDAGPVLPNSSPLSITIHIPRFTTQQRADGSTLFSLANGGSHLAPTNGPALPLLVRSLVLPQNMLVTDVKMTINESHLYATPVTLSRFNTQTSNEDVINGTYSMPPVLPERIFEYRITPKANGSLLTLSVIPMEFDTSSHQVRLYDRVSFTVEGVYALPSGPQIGQVTINNGMPIQVNKPDQRIQVAIAHTTPATTSFRWVVHDPAGFVIDSGRMALSLIDGTTSVQFSLNTMGWSPGPKDLAIYLQDDHGLVSSQNRAIMAEGVWLYEWLMTSHEYRRDAGVAVWDVEAIDERGQLITGLSAFVTTIDGQATTVQVSEVGVGKYQLAIPIADLTVGGHTLMVQTTDQRGITSHQTWLLRIEAYAIYLPLLSTHQR